MHAVTGAGPQVAVQIEPEAIKQANAAVGKVLPILQAAAVRGQGVAAQQARAVGHMGGAGVDHIQPALVGREGQAIGAHHVLHHRLHFAAVRVNAVDPGRADFGFGGIAFVVRVNAVGGVGEPDAVVRLDHQVIGRIQAFAVPVAGQHGALTVMLTARDAAATVFAGEHPALAVQGVAVGVPGRLLKHRDRAVGLVPAHHPVVRNIGPQQVAPGRHIDRAFCPAAATGEFLQVHIAGGIAGEARVQHLKGRGQHRVLLQSSQGAARQCAGSGPDCVAHAGLWDARH